MLRWWISLALFLAPLVSQLDAKTLTVDNLRRDIENGICPNPASALVPFTYAKECGPQQCRGDEFCAKRWLDCSNRVDGANITIRDYNAFVTKNCKGKGKGTAQQAPSKPLPPLPPIASEEPKSSNEFKPNQSINDLRARRSEVKSVCDRTIKNCEAIWPIILRKGDTSPYAGTLAQACIRLSLGRPHYCLSDGDEVERSKMIRAASDVLKYKDLVYKTAYFKNAPANPHPHPGAGLCESCATKCPKLFPGTRFGNPKSGERGEYPQCGCNCN